RRDPRGGEPVRRHPAAPSPRDAGRGRGALPVARLPLRCPHRQAARRRPGAARRGARRPRGRRGPGGRRRRGGRGALTARALLAGFGNVLRGDDGFGVEVVRRLQEGEPAPDVTVMEVGTAGIRLAQELLTPCDRLIIVDAMRGGGPPGTVYV